MRTLNLLAGLSAVRARETDVVLILNQKRTILSPPLFPLIPLTQLILVGISNIPDMPIVTIVDFMGEVQKEITVESGTKLLKGLMNSEVDIVHTCGGNAKCTTCRVTIHKGVPTKKTQAQQDRFERAINSGQPQFDHPAVFLSCQVVVEDDMTVSASENFNSVIHDSRGKDTEDKVTPDPVWLDHEVPDWWGIKE
ncbi:MAG: 2Fe-2S iron-sulfur cluster-binding protein [Candidatus Thorarchaeota archaeon]|jgi:ferredoxin